MNRKPLLLFGLCPLSMAGGEARATDMEYCAELTVMYRKYLGQTSSRQTMPDVAASTPASAATPRPAFRCWRNG